ncbi:MAG: GGDEF and EAL domain-containing protein [Azospirillaceae bacterium]
MAGHDTAEGDGLTAAMVAAGDVVYDWDLVTDRIRWSGPAKRLFATTSLDGYETGDAYHGRVNPEDLPHRLKSLAEHYRAPATYDCEYRVRQADGGFCWVHDRGAAELSLTGEPVRMRGVLRVITRRKLEEAHLVQMANYDDLTGCMNRNRLRDVLNRAVVQGRKAGRSGAYLTVGVDKLSLINSAFGYLTADAVIVAAAQRLTRAVGADDVVGRLGGDTFGVVLPDCAETEMPQVAERILELFRAHPIDTPSGPIHCSVSIGGVAFPSFVQSVYEALTRADSALQEAKRRGRDRFWAYRVTEAERRDHRTVMTVAEQVKDALKKDRLLLAIQPVVRTGDHRVDFNEALLRLRDTEGGIVPAGVFVPVIERLGLMREMDARVLDLAVARLVADPQLRLAMNISGLTAVDQGWLRQLEGLVGGDRSVAERLTVEITETAAIQDIEETARFVAGVRELGCRIALDDFGAGYTSFRHLKTLTVDIVKIDGAFVRGIATNPDNRMFVRTLVGLARNFGLATVAECVETAEDAAALREEKVDWLQGWYFARPSVDHVWPFGAVLPDPEGSREGESPAPIAPHPNRRVARAG